MAQLRVLVYGSNGSLGAAIVKHVRASRPAWSTVGIDVTPCPAVHHSIQVRRDDAMFPSRQVRQAKPLNPNP